MGPSEGLKQRVASRRLGVVGTLVRDTLYAFGETEPRSGWGGIAYALPAFEAALPEEWELVPIVRVGSDLFDEAKSLLGELACPVDLSAVVSVPEPNNRVELRYFDAQSRVEILSGGVSGWGCAELTSVVDSLDALYVNFISGFEMSAEVAQTVLSGFSGPSFVDLHSLFLDVAEDGTRLPRSLDGWEQWLALFDVVQMNETEFHLLSGRRDPWGGLGRGLDQSPWGSPTVVVVTLGERGVEFVAIHPQEGPMGSPQRLTCEGVSGDPTGCGDVWGATAFSGLLAGKEVREAFSWANRAASAAVAWNGTDGLGQWLQSVASEPMSEN